MPTSWCVVALIICCWLLFGARVGRRGLWSAHEGRAAQNAQNILTTGRWLTPTLYTGDVEMQKPPLYYWMVSLAALLEGRVTPFAVRAPATFAAMASVLLVFVLGRRIWDVETGLGAAVVLATCTRFAWDSRVGRIDMPLTLLCLTALAIFWRSTVDPEAKDRTRIPWSFYVLVGLGLLLKGPIAVVLILAPVVIWMWWAGEPVAVGLQEGWRKTWKDARFVPGLLLALAVALPWYLYTSYVTGGEFFWRFLVYHNFDRALGTKEALKSAPIWFYIPRLFVDAFPWSLLLGPLAFALWHHRSKLSDVSDRSTRSYLFLLSWLGSHFLLLSMVSFKRADYLLPAYPALALLISGWLRDRLSRFEKRWATKPPRNPGRRRRAILISASVLSLTALPLLIWASVAFVKKGVVNSILKIGPVNRHLNETDRFMMHNIERLVRDSWPLLVIAMVVVVGCIWVFHTGWHNRRNGWILTGMAGPWLAIFLFHVHVVLPALDQLRDMGRFADVVRNVVPESHPVYYFGKFDDDLVYYVGKPARLVGEWEDLVDLGVRKEACYVVMKAEHLPWIKRDPRMSHWIQIANNRPASGLEHRQPRVLLTNNPYAVAAPDRLRQDY